eukprot:8513477-Pyramimonas_sp.AAC.1
MCIVVVCSNLDPVAYGNTTGSLERPRELLLRRPGQRSDVSNGWHIRYWLAMVAAVCAQRPPCDRWIRMLPSYPSRLKGNVYTL